MKLAVVYETISFICLCNLLDGLQEREQDKQEMLQLPFLSTEVAVSVRVGDFVLFQRVNCSYQWSH